MLSVVQIKAARSMLGWSAVDLADKAGISPATVKRYEIQSGIPAANTVTLSLIKTTLESAGIEFTGDPLVNPGVTLHLER
ncbi:helix-turn-helix transcriptional regulator [Gammaproteobacteria bacterium]|nr:helix-turn-helix transcriptional regulator [Gammaproteobacteria bacterium]